MIWKASRVRAAGAFSLVLALMIAPAMFGWPWWQISAALLLCILAGTIAVEDLAAMTIPDWASIAIAVVAIALMVMQGSDGRQIAAALAVAIGTTASILALTWIYGQIRGIDVLGLGDVKLIGASTVLIGPWGIAMQLFIASVAAILFVVFRTLRRGRRLRMASRVPYGTFLAPAAIIVWAWLQQP